MSKLVHILHKDDKNCTKMLCTTLNQDRPHVIGIYDWTWKHHGDAWLDPPTCQACILLAMIEPENVYQTWENHDNTHTTQRQRKS